MALVVVVSLFFATRLDYLIYFVFSLDKLMTGCLFCCCCCCAAEDWKFLANNFSFFFFKLLIFIQISCFAIIAVVTLLCCCIVAAAAVVVEHPCPTVAIVGTILIAENQKLCNQIANNLLVGLHWHGLTQHGIPPAHIYSIYT